MSRGNAPQSRWAEAFSLAASLAAGHLSDHYDKSGRPIIEHVVRVTVSSIDACPPGYDTLFVGTCAMLHDVAEDTEITVDGIRNIFGKEVASVVDALTWRPGELRSDYITRLMQDSVAILIKREDRLDNCLAWRWENLDDTTRARLYARYRDDERQMDGKSRYEDERGED
jgi:(p)ppGpp synthase/HD superfamily hydrolase